MSIIQRKSISFLRQSVSLKLEMWYKTYQSPPYTSGSMISASHFLTVSAIVYLIILCAVLIGTAIPAVKIIGARITHALRDE